jgi:uncharacterized protein YkwD
VGVGPAAGRRTVGDIAKTPLRRLLVAPALCVALVTTVLVGAGAASAQAPTPPRPDGLIRRASESAFVGNGIYNTNGAGQTRSAVVGANGLVRFYVRVQNDGPDPGDIRVIGTPESSAFAVRYYVGSRSVSPAVKAGTFVFNGVHPGAHRTLTVEVEPRAASDPGDQRRVVISARAVADGSVRDNVVADVRRPLYTAEQQRIAALINGSRRDHGRAALAMHRQLTTKAQAWAQHMAREGRLSHSNLRDGAPAGWRALAENVGVGGSITSVHATFMGSSTHRANILGNFNYVGTGYAVGHGRVWIVHEFALI